MPFIQVTSKAYTAICLASRTGHPEDPDHPSTQLDSGYMKVWLEDDTLDRLIRACREGESISDAICRLVTKAGFPTHSLRN